MNILKSSKMTWIDIRSPEKADMDYLRERFPFESHTLNELLSPTIRPIVESHNEYLYIVLHVPVYSEDKKTTEPHELDILMTREALITVAYDNIRPLKNFQLKCMSESVHRAYCLGKSPAHLLFYIIESLFEYALRELDHIQETIDAIEEQLFTGREKKMLERISHVRQDVLDFRRTMKPQKIVLTSLLHHGIEFYGTRARPLFRDMLGQFNRVWEILENHKESIESLHETNESLLSTKTNEIMKILTIFAVITFPLTLLASVFGMNTKYLPIVGNPYDFWFITGFMLLATVCMFMYFKAKHWI